MSIEKEILSYVEVEIEVCLFSLARYLTPFHRYSAATILALLQEVNQFASSKINWDSLVKMTSTGISCPREYQMLWRHIAYRHPLEDNTEHDSKPLVSLIVANAMIDL